MQPNIVRVIGTKSLIRQFLDEDPQNLNPVTSSRQVSIDSHHHAESVNLTDVQVDVYSSTTGITQMNNYGLTTTIIYSGDDLQAHIDEFSLEMGRDGSPSV